MIPLIRVVGLGQRAAGDDAAGIEVIRALQANRPDGVELFELLDASALVEMLDGGPLLVVDAVVGAGTPGAVVELSVDALATTRAVSTHGVGLVQAVGLARAVNGEGCDAGLVVLGITIAPPDRLAFGMSEGVAAAVELAAERVRAWVEEVRGA